MVGLRLHAKVPPPPLSQAQLILLCGLWQRKEQPEPSYASLQQAAPLKFGLPLPFREMAKWDVTVNEQAIDVGEVSKQNYIGRTPAAALPAALKGSDEWASWVFSLSEIWQDDAPMQDRPLEVHCSGLGGGLLSGEHDYDIHPASRGVAAHTAGLFRSVRGAKGGFPPWGLFKLRSFNKKSFQNIVFDSVFPMFPVKQTVIYTFFAIKAVNPSKTLLLTVFL